MRFLLQYYYYVTKQNRILVDKVKTKLMSRHAYNPGTILVQSWFIGIIYGLRFLVYTSTFNKTNRFKSNIHMAIYEFKII